MFVEPTLRDVHRLAVCQSWQERRVARTSTVNTVAEGLATRVPFELPLSIINLLADGFVLVSDDEMRRAIVLLLETTHGLAEGVGAASTAAAHKIREQLHGQKVALILTGGNLTFEQLRQCLALGQR